MLANVKRDDVIDAAIDRLSELHSQKKAIEAQELELRDMIKAWAVREGVDFELTPKYVTPGGSGVTFYTMERQTADFEYLRKILKPHQVRRAISTVVSRCMRLF